MKFHIWMIWMNLKHLPSLTTTTKAALFEASAQMCMVPFRKLGRPTRIIANKKRTAFVAFLWEVNLLWTSQSMLISIFGAWRVINNNIYIYFVFKSKTSLSKHTFTQFKASAQAFTLHNRYWLSEALQKPERPRRIVILDFRHIFGRFIHNDYICQTC